MQSFSAIIQFADEASFASFLAEHPLGPGVGPIEIVPLACDEVKTVIDAFRSDVLIHRQTCYCNHPDHVGLPGNVYCSDETSQCDDNADSNNSNPVITITPPESSSLVCEFSEKSIVADVAEYHVSDFFDSPAIFVDSGFDSHSTGFDSYPPDEILCETEEHSYPPLSSLSSSSFLPNSDTNDDNGDDSFPNNVCSVGNNDGNGKGGKASPPLRVPRPPDEHYPSIVLGGSFSPGSCPPSRLSHQVIGNPSLSPLPPPNPSLNPWDSAKRYALPFVAVPPNIPGSVKISPPGLNNK